MPPSTIDTVWGHSLVGAKADKATDRTGTPPENAYELIGVDGSANGGMRPFQGFIQIGAAFTSAASSNATFKGFSLPQTDKQKHYIGFVHAERVYALEVGVDTSFTLVATNPSVPDDIAVVDRTLFALDAGDNPTAHNKTAASWNQYTAGPGAQHTATTGAASTTNVQVVLVAGGLLPPGDYGVAVQFSDSATGRKSNVSHVRHIEESEFTAGAKKTIQVNWVFPTGFDTITIFRSVKTQAAGGTFAANPLFIDRVVTGTTSANLQLQDLELIYQDPFTDQPIFSATVKKAGAGIGYEGSLIISNVKDSSSDKTSDGYVRWSSLTYASPELFSPNSVFYDLPTADPIVYKECAGNVIGLGRTKLFHVRKEAGFIKVQAMHEGYGIVNKNAVDVVGSVVYYVNETGLKAVDANGQLDAVRALDYLIQNEWASTLAYVWVAHDPLLKALVLLNTSLKRLAIVWFETSKFTEVYDCPFVAMTRMPYYSVLTGAFIKDSALVERAVFYGEDGNLYVIDSARQKTKRTMMPVDGDSIFKITNSSPAGVLTLINEYPVAGFPTTALCKNSYLYVLNGVLAGTRYKILSVSGSTITVSPPILGVAPEDNVKVGISPVYTRWVGAPVGLVTEDAIPFGNKYDYFRVRHISSLGVALVDVSGGMSTRDVARWRGSVWKGAQTTARTSAFPKKTSGEDVRSMIEGESSNIAAFGGTGTLAGKFGIDGTVLAAGWECFCPDLDYKVLSVMVNGSVTGEVRTARAS